MSARTARRLVWSLAALTLSLLVLSAVAYLSGSGWHLLAGFFWAFALIFLGVGGLIAIRHPRNAIGWLFLTVAVASGLGEATHGYAQYWIEGGAGSDTLGKAAAAYSNVSWIPFVVVPTTFLLLLFPDGRLLSHRWRPIAWCAGLSIAALFLTAGLAPGPLEDFPQVVNPYGWHSSLQSPLEGLAFLLFLVAVIGSAVSMILRFRRSRGEQRLQLKWLASAAATAAIVVPIGTLGYDVWGEFISNAVIMLSVLGLPLASGIAILKYRLYDIDLIINRTLVYGALTAILAIAYLGLVVVLQEALSFATQESDLAVAGSTLAVAGLFRPLR
ncbi:MAG: hypothetical protein H0U53_09145, partial [Actinobacteria bacterium]|nr:hypothetical protein [Actinomycetota bacterium]